MPLHLLGKKSWNVYNQDNIARVRRDEAEARLREEEEQRRAQIADAEARLQLLRDAIPETLTTDKKSHVRREEPAELYGRSKRRKIQGEDDTDREIRLVQEFVAEAPRNPESCSRKSKDVSLVDSRGHISLFDDSGRKPQPNEEATAEAAKKQREFEDQYTMRFSNAAGNRPGSDKPWYIGAGGQANADGPLVERDIWGNEDPRRKDREKRRLDSNDPLASMKKGVKQLRNVDRHREEWRLQREKDLNEVEELARKETRRRKRRDSDEDSLEGFDLDNGYEKKRRHGHGSKDEPRRHKKRHGDSSGRHRRHHRSGHA